MTISQFFFASLIPYMPAMVANMAPVIAAKWNVFSWLNRPINTRIFGSHKTIRGVVVACGAGAITGAAQSMVLQSSIVSGLYVGGIVGLGAITGDVIKSFFKRRLHIASGKSWIPFDQIDFVLGATVVLMAMEKISFPSALVAIIIIGCLSYIVSAIGFALHIKENL